MADCCDIKGGWLNETNEGQLMCLNIEASRWAVATPPILVYRFVALLNSGALFTVHSELYLAQYSRHAGTLSRGRVAVSVSNGTAINEGTRLTRHER